MNGIRSLIGDGETEVGDETVFGYEYISGPASFLLGHDPLDGKRHVQFHSAQPSGSRNAASPTRLSAATSRS